MIPRASSDSIWKIDFEFLLETEKEIRKGYGESVTLQELQAIILYLIEKGYVKDI